MFHIEGGIRRLLIHRTNSFSSAAVAYVVEKGDFGK